MNIEKYISDNTAELYRILKELCLIPAPSHHEEKRAEYCKKWLEDNGAEGVYIDKALNVVYPVNIGDSREITVIAAHTDTVFPDTEPMPYREADGKAFCPGVGDDTASLAVLLLTAKYFAENDFKPEKGMLIVCNSCEEGLGNLKGTKQLFTDYAGRISAFLSFDSASLLDITTDCVGSHRYEVAVKTPGGHSYGSFGNKNALAEISKIVTKIYEITPPKKDGTKTTYNVGGISGGTNINTIAEEATMLCEYRSDDLESLEIMKAKFEAIFDAARCDDVSVDVKLIGERPCSDVDRLLQDSLIALCEKCIRDEGIETVEYRHGSTDCNIPLSMGIPAVSVGVYTGGGAHTREEWVELSSLPRGLSRAIRLALAF